MQVGWVAVFQNKIEMFCLALSRLCEPDVKSVSILKLKDRKIGRLSSGGRVDMEYIIYIYIYIDYQQQI